MLSLTKKTDYALIALGFLAEHRDRTSSAREIAEAFEMPGALVMNILKTLHHAGLVSSTRGTKGGYRLTANLADVSLHRLIGILEGPVRLAECVMVEGECHEPGNCKIRRVCPVQAPIQALHEKLTEFLKGVKLSEIVAARRCTEAPVELLVGGQHEGRALPWA